MFSDKNLPEPLFITEIEKEISLSVIDEQDHIFFDNQFTNERRIRTYIYKMLLNAQKFLPDGYCFKIYEAYRPLGAQKKLWDEVKKEQKIDINTYCQNDMSNIFIKIIYQRFIPCFF